MPKCISGAPNRNQMVLRMVRNISEMFYEKQKWIENLYTYNIWQTNMTIWCISSEYCCKTSFSTDNCLIVRILWMTSVASCKRNERMNIEYLVYQIVYDKLVFFTHKNIMSNNLILPNLLVHEWDYIVHSTTSPSVYLDR